MAKVSLRIYNKEIERLVEQGQTDEAIAHCRHILKTFPKHLETYRLLGKAYLEARRYAEAVDIFGRLLMAVPEDFVAHVGLSIIRDEENKLDDAIWHMERAFEVQSSNAAIQAELQRLYGRRDGMEPPKIRMTRGALARIYVLGELYPQAIAEIRAVLSEDSQRVDMQTLLAYSYFKSGSRADATDLCNQLLKRYVYSFDANRIMVELLPASVGAESTQVYRMRISEMDPYVNFTKGSVFDVLDVPDASINLERLEYSGEEVQMGQDWNNASLGFSSVPPLGGSISFGNEQPDWLRSGMDETPQDSAAPVSPPQAGEPIPDFLRDAGWGASSQPEKPTSIFDEEPGDSSLVQADIPEWLKSQAPSAPIESVAVEPPDYLSGLDTSFDPFADTATPAGGAPDWLKGTDDAGSSAQPAAESDVPDWLKNMETPQAESAPVAGDAPDWLSGLSGAVMTAKAEPLNDEPLAQTSELPDWLQSSKPASESVANVENLGASAQEQDDAVAWLESLAAKHGAKPEELVTDPNKRSETPPEWVAQAQGIGKQAPADSEPVKSEWSPTAANVGEEFFTEFEKASTSQPGMDETGMWLNDLNKGKETSAEADQLPDWMKPEEPVPAQRQEALLDTASLPDWLGGLDKPEEPVYESEETLVKSQDLSDWLSGLDNEPGLDIDPATLRAPEPPFEQNRPEPQSTDIPDWMKTIEEVEDDWKPPATSALVEAKEESSISLSADLPEWLQSVDEETSAKDEDLTPWESREQWEAEGGITSPPKPTSPSDWHPVAAAGQKEAAPPQAQPGLRLVQNPPAPEPSTPVARKNPASKRGLPHQRKPDGQGSVTVLNLAKSELDRGDIPESMVHFGKLIKKGKHLEEIIGSLSESLYRYPVEVSIWQALGDAYMRANRLKEALDAYNKAEELIR